MPRRVIQRCAQVLGRALRGRRARDWSRGEVRALLRDLSPARDSTRPSAPHGAAAARAPRARRAAPLVRARVEHMGVAKPLPDLLLADRARPAWTGPELLPL